MEYFFSSHEIAEMAMHVEEAGIEFYRKAAEFAADEKIKKIFLFLSNAEIDHRNTFRDIMEAEQENDSLDECLNDSLFKTLDDARGIIKNGRIDYNRVRPHSSLDNLTPEEYAQANTTQTPEKTNLLAEPQMKMIEHSKPTIGNKEVKAVLDVMRTGLLFEGDVVKKFEEELSSYIGSVGGVAASTGTLALYLALLCLGVAEGDEVIAPSYTCRSVLNGILYSGAKPVLCDVNVKDYNISFEAAKAAITKKTKVIIVPHMFGYAAEIEKFSRLGVYIIEDCAHLVGAEHQGKKLGSFGDLSIFSFEGTKYIVAGEGGMVLANDARLLSKLRKLKEPNSFDSKLKHTYRMTNLQAAVGCAQLPQVETFINKRRRIAAIYSDNFSDLGIELPEERPQSMHAFHRYMVKVKGNIRILMEDCYKDGVKVKQPVKPWPLHHYLGLSGKGFPNTEHIMKSAVSIPIYPSLSDKQIGHIVKTVTSVASKIK